MLPVLPVICFYKTQITKHTIKVNIVGCLGLGKVSVVISNQLVLVLSPSVPCTLAVPANPVGYIAAVCNASLLLMWVLHQLGLISSKNVTYLLSRVKMER